MEKKSKTYNKDIYLVLAASFFYMASPMLVTPIIVGFTESLNASGIVMGIIGGLTNIASLFCRPLSGFFSDKISKYKLSFIGAVFMAIASLFYAIAPSTFLLILGRICHGIGFALCSVCMSTWISEMLPRDKIGSGMGLYGTVNAISMALIPALGIELKNLFGYRVAFLIAAIFSAILIIIIQFVKDKGEPKVDIIKSINKKRKFEIVEKKVIPIALIIMLFTIPYSATSAFLVTYIESKNLKIISSLFFPIYALVVFILRLTLKEFFNKWPYKIFFIMCSISAFIFMFSMWLLNSYFTFILAAIFMASGFGILFSVTQSTALVIANQGKKGLANSTFYIGIDLGLTIGPFLGGLIYNYNFNLLFPILMSTIPLSIIVAIFYFKKSLKI